jgi:hypothetical protein
MAQLIRINTYHTYRYDRVYYNVVDLLATTSLAVAV